MGIDLAPQRLKLRGSPLNLSKRWIDLAPQRLKLRGSPFLLRYNLSQRWIDLAPPFPKVDRFGSTFPKGVFGSTFLKGG